MTLRRFPILISACVAVSLLFACGGGDADPEESAPQVSAAAMAEAEQYFTTTCTVCHGTIGKGDGPGSRGLEPQPRDFTEPTWQASVDNAYLSEIIVRGGAAVGRSPVMPGNPVLKSKPEVVQGLVAKIRSLEGK
jgi:mono/diheme cytochrome c family protein